MQDIATYFKDYGAYHRTPGNKLSHMIGIPLIILGLLGLLNRIVLAPWDVPLINLSPALIIWVLGNIFYVRLHTLLGLTMYLSTFALYVIGVLLPVPVLWGLFILGWIAQFIGHYAYEKKSPAFFQNLTHVLVGPMYIQNYLLKLYK